MKDKQTQMWLPLYVDKWLFGSTRLELEPAERAVFIDLMVLGAKDNGYIRANEITPYLPRQLAAFLNIPEEILASTIEKCIKFGKLEEPKQGIYRLCNWEKYQFSRQYVHEINTKGIPSLQNCKADQTDCKAIRKDSIEKDKREEDITTTAIVPDKPDTSRRDKVRVNWENCKTDHQRLGAYYLKCYAPDTYAVATVGQATEFFKRQSNALISICKQAGDIETAKRCLDIAAKFYCDRPKPLSWNLDTVSRNMIEFIDKARG